VTSHCQLSTKLIFPDCVRKACRAETVAIVEQVLFSFMFVTMGVINHLIVKIFRVFGFFLRE
ncbi:MAG: hypothetical protein ABI772_09865, partial [Bacteroidota bacterium]